MPRYTDVNREVFKDNVRALRKHLGLSGDELGALLSVTGGAIRNWEAGGASPGEERLHAIVRIARERGVDVDLAYLITGIGAQPEWRRTNTRPRRPHPPRIRLDAAPVEASVTVSGPGLPGDAPHLTGVFLCQCGSFTLCDRANLEPGRVFHCYSCNATHVSTVSPDEKREWIKIAQAAAA
jgi:transcriptional regulator with XRE-family HTH domain